MVPVQNACPLLQSPCEETLRTSGFHRFSPPGNWMKRPVLDGMWVIVSILHMNFPETNVQRRL